MRMLKRLETLKTQCTGLSDNIRCIAIALIRREFDSHLAQVHVFHNPDFHCQTKLPRDNWYLDLSHWPSSVLKSNSIQTVGQCLSNAVFYSRFHSFLLDLRRRVQPTVPPNRESHN
eukprot:Gregarina_sp_Poly_1__7356@NODE_4060_length_753_cov_5_418367_g2648_i0_p1_GENE_NODE_4060_length_753_cov_5_418367_g2648_i0NODE_4060_length_753_cov_5_418367_g2648_i0_p1_ORF_typecomplete_len116_score6_95_NODE_4060_length_753_cov_5_418367_g2648_i0269616